MGRSIFDFVEPRMPGGNYTKMLKKERKESDNLIHYMLSLSPSLRVPSGTIIVRIAFSTM